MLIYIFQMQTVYQTVVFNWHNKENISGQYPIHPAHTIEKKSSYYSITEPLSKSKHGAAGNKTGLKILESLCLSAELPKNKIFLERDRNMFLFQIYTGYYYKDLRALRKDQLMKDEAYGFFILGERDKNGNDTFITLYKFPHAMKILEKYAAEEKSKMVLIRMHLLRTRPIIVILRKSAGWLVS